MERLSPEISPSRFRVLAAIAGDNNRADLNISAAVRKQLTDSGVTIVRYPGRFDTEADAVRRACDPATGTHHDGVLFIHYNRLELFDCATHRAAYEISGGNLGIQQMANRLIVYLRRDGPVGTTEK